MDKIWSELNNLCMFAISFLFLYVPCVIGTFCGLRFNQLKTPKTSIKSKKKTTIRTVIASALVSSIIPTLIILIGEHLFPGAANMSYVVKYALVILLGFIGSDKITTYMMDIVNTLKVMKAIQGGVPGLSDLANDLAKDNTTSEETENNDENK